MVGGLAVALIVIPSCKSKNVSKTKLWAHPGLFVILTSDCEVADVGIVLLLVIVLA
jgi:hypothetical protein